MDRQPDYEPRSEIARMKSFNAVEGFHCYHIQWTIEKLPLNPARGYINSETFKTNGDVEWYLRFFVSKHRRYPLIDLQRSYKSMDAGEIPVIGRVKAINESKGIVEFSSSASCVLSESTKEWAHAWDIREVQTKNLSSTDKYVIHCWLDIPKKYDNCSDNPCGRNSGTILLSTSLARSFEKITIKNGDPTSDIELLIKDGAEDHPRFYCHRHILAARSPVFETMFTNGHQFKETNDRIVEIEDVDASTLKLVLQYLYTGQITKQLRDDMEKKLITSLLNAAEKYMLPELKDECVLALIGFDEMSCDDEEWMEYLQLAETFNLEYFKKVCMLALSTNLRSLDEEQRGLVSPQAMTELLELATKRGDFIQMIEVKTTDV